MSTKATLEKSGPTATWIDRSARIADLQVEFIDENGGGPGGAAMVAFDFRRQVAFVKFIGTHSEYDRIDPLTVSQY